MTPERVEDELKKLTDLPAPVRTWLVEIGWDWTGDDAIWVWGVMDKRHLSREVVGQTDAAVRRAVREAAGEPTPFVFIRYRETPRKRNTSRTKRP